MKSIFHIALASLIIAAVLALSGSYTVQAAESTYCYTDNLITQPSCGMPKEECKNAEKTASKDLNANCVNQEGTK
jgi:hypothetical protein